MYAIKYLKLDLRISRKTLLSIMPTFAFVPYIFTKGMYIVGLAYLLLLLVICANIPFTAQGNEKLECLYHIFPAKVSKMVISRFIYLIIWYITIFSIEAILMTYLSSINKINNTEIIMMCLSEIIVAIFLFIQYPISYKVGLEKGAIISNIICGLPAFIIYVLPSFFNRFLIENLESYVNFIINNRNILATFSALIVIIIGYVSYLISCGICKRKEV